MKLLWEDIYRFTITKSAFYLYTSNIKAIIIPKRFFENENDIVELSELLKSKINTNNYMKQNKKLKYIKIGFYVFIVGLLSIFIFSQYTTFSKYQKINEAIACENNKDFKQASLIYSEIIKEYPEEAENYVARANCELELGNYQGVIMDCEIAISFNPKFGKAYYLYAYALSNVERYGQACKAMKMAVEFHFTENDEGFCDPQ